MLVSPYSALPVGCMIKRLLVVELVAVLYWVHMKSEMPKMQRPSILQRQDIQSCFLYNYSLYQWEIAMHTNMGGGLPSIGFWEMKQDIYETLRI